MSNDAGVKQEICRPSEAPADKIDPATDVAESIALPTGCEEKIQPMLH